MKNPFFKYLAFLSIMMIPLLFARCKEDANDTNAGKKELLRGIDISFLPQIRQYGISFKNQSGQEGDLLKIVKENGVNLVRIRLWTGNPGKHSGEDEVYALAEECRNQGFKILLDLHYSDTWADPGHQTIPASWLGLDINQLKDSVYRYTFRVTSKCRPDYIQIGNEINAGLLWPTGHISRSASMDELLKVGCNAARDAHPAIKILLHYAGIDGSIDFFKKRNETGIDYDIAALSYYPYWHGSTIADMGNTLNDIRFYTKKEVMIVEFAYPFTLKWSDHTNNVIGLESQLSPGYPATAEGQAVFVRTIRTVCEKYKAKGLCYWGGEWVAFKGDTSSNRSSWENQALFDFDFRANPALTEYR